MRFQVFRYLSKPIDKNRLFRNLNDALHQYNTETKEYLIETPDGLIIKRAEEIVCVECAQRKTYIYTTGGILRSIKSIEYWKQQLALPCFFSPHRSFVINLRYVVHVEKDIVHLRYGSHKKDAYLTRRKFTEFKNTYLMYLESVK